MTVFAATRCLHICSQIRSRSLRVPLLAKKGYSSDGPVRYVPKSPSPTQKPQNPPALGSGENKGGILFGASEGKHGSRELPKFEEKEGQHSLFHDENSNPSDIFGPLEVVTDPEEEKCPLAFINLDDRSKSELIIDEISNFHDAKIAETNDLLSHTISQDATKMAVELLAGRAWTELELRKKLRGKKYPPAIVKSVLNDIKCRGLLNDGLYAESFSRSRWLSSTWGPRRIKQALIKKGVAEAKVDKATKQVFEEDNVNGGREMQHGMSKASTDHLFLQASKQWLRGESISLENRKARIVRWLQYRGFNWGITSAILKKLEAQYPMTEGKADKAMNQAQYPPTEVKADNTTKQVFENDGSTMQRVMAKASMDDLFLQASKLWLRGQSTSLENRKARIVRWLRYRGFNWKITTAVLKKLEAQYPA